MLERVHLLERSNEVRTGVGDYPQTRAELGDCSRSYVYKLIALKVLESVNLGGRRRLIKRESIRRLQAKRQAAA
jgi:excisionase family DNA binding protein